MVAVLKSQMSDREIPIRSIFDSYRYFFINKNHRHSLKAISVITYHIFTLHLIKMVHIWCIGAK